MHRARGVQRGNLPTRQTLLAIACALLATAGGADEHIGAQDIEADERIEEIVVSSRIGSVDQLVVVFDEETIDANFHQVDVLRSLPGLALSAAGNRGSLTQARLRGAEANHLLVLIDGIAANNPATGAEFNFGTLDSAGIRRAALLAGPQSAVWGSDALAGVLALDTTPATDGRRLSLGYGTHDTVDADAAFATVGDNGFAALDVGFLDSNGTNAALEGDEEDGFTNTTAHFRGSRDTGDWTFSSSARWTDAETDFDPSPAPAFIPADGDRQTQDRLALLHARVGFLGFDRFEPSLAVSTLRTELRSLAEGTLQNTFAGRRDTATLAGNILLDRQRFNVTMEAETERFEQTGEATPFGNPNQEQRITTLSTAGEYQVDFANVALTVSARRDFNDEFADALAYRLGATTRNNPRWFASIGRGIKNPTFVERFGYTPDTFFGNPDLAPESSVGLEAGMAWTWQDGSLALVAFDNALRNEIDPFVFSERLGGFTARNQDGRSRRRGAEITLDAAWHRYRLRANVAYVDTTDGEGRRELRRPRQMADVSVQARLTASVSAGLGILHNGAVVDRDYSTFPAANVNLDGFRLLRLNVNVEPSPKWRLSLLADNLLDAEHSAVYGYRSPGRSAMARLEWRL